MAEENLDVIRRGYEAFAGTRLVCINPAETVPQHARGQLRGPAGDRVGPEERAYTVGVPVNTRVPEDIERRLSTLGGALEQGCPAVEFAYIFGSASRGEMTPRSDIDLAVYLSPDTDLNHNRLEAARVAARHLGTDALDVVLLNTAPISVAGRVLTSRRVLVDRRPFVRHAYESRTARLFQDFRIREHRILTRRYARG